MPAGTITAFDEQRGLGTVTAAGREYPFHTTQIADGSRSVRAGQAVTFDVVPGRRGDWEAVRIAKSGAPTAPEREEPATRGADGAHSERPA
jgi:cold shock CspA family protein